MFFLFLTKRLICIIMRAILFLFGWLFLTSFAFSQVNPKSTYVNGYYKSNGTYVEGYYRTTPNNTINDNYSTYPNTNPYTGNQGTVQPSLPSIYSTPSYPNTFSTPSYPNTNSTPNYFRYP